MHDPRLQPVPPYSALIFDCDGTLVDSGPAHERAWRQALADSGVELDLDWYRERTGLSADVLLAELEEETGKPIDHAVVEAAAVDAFGRMLDLVLPNEPVVAVARDNHGQVPLAVASGGSRRAVEVSLRAIGVYPLFDAVVTRDDVSRGKPAPDIYLLAAERLGVCPGDCLVYEDTDEGMAAARAAGMRVIDVRPAPSSARSDAVPDSATSRV
ncbi:fructose-1-phosphate/6-phosphogluconate phosphatase [Planotetraspora phitsanulokensis]|uniref:Fructose-1-phosphate/6-phosphogluconate phosphatase n=1 Tax=Planotetraspora phitsanulokensis TaxID=575192 RepID=A0A8J3TZP6_9ACTN|nr:HAD family phosphatase [Planotetraspora phitsanulokensis]GII35680.1 fructose-1-phosphate/6-phosphogluconate phosphatase [Planotetraspora phitsanulokensis]